jgi:NADH:ubiquinone oxidoreductase subunit 2 (subunit N)
MNDVSLGWVLLTPLVGALVAAGLWLVSRRKGTSPQTAFWLDAAALVSACAGLMAGPLLLLLANTGATFSLLGIDFASSPIARLILPIVHAALIAVIFLSWDIDQQSTGDVHPALVSLGAMSTASLIAGALLVNQRTVQALLLFGVALVASAAAMSRPRLLPGQGRERERLRARLAGGLKHIALAAIATALLIAGAILLDRYALTLEKRALLQLGLSLLSVGLLVRVGAMPFTAAAADIVRGAPGVAILVLGVAVPATLGAGLLMLTPIEGSLVSASQTTWIAAVSVLLAGVRALGIPASDESKDNHKRQLPRIELPVLIAMSVATQAGWALFGLLSGSRLGATGAMLLAANLTMAVPLMVISYHLSATNNQPTKHDKDDPENTQYAIRNTQSKIGLAIGAASLLGLPPFGGFTGTLMVAQSAANIGGIWLGVMLIGSLLLGLAWARTGIGSHGSGAGNGNRTNLMTYIWEVKPLLIIVLIAAQLGLFLLSSRIADALGIWAGTPWLFAP